MPIARSSERVLAPVCAAMTGAFEFAPGFAPGLIRLSPIEELMAHAPAAPELLRLAHEYGADRNRFEKEATFCVMCGLCVRYCAEVKRKHAVGFIENGHVREISFIPEIAANECWDCQECFALCPTSYAQAAYFLTEALAFPGRRKAGTQTA